MNGDTGAIDWKEAVLEAALAHVPFDGWSETTLKAAIADSGASPALARALFPRGGIDLAVAYHLRGDRAALPALMARPPARTISVT
mgnify:CR=1 FL=1